jgi:Ca-activated chloride channel homolog
MMGFPLSFEFPWLLLLIPLWLFFVWLKNKRKLQARKVGLGFPIHPGQEPREEPFLQAVFMARKWIFHLAVLLLIVAVARPGNWEREKVVEGVGLDIVIALDLSSSMLAQDFQPDRLEVSKKLMQDFIRERPVDRLGIVGFAGESFTMSPLTTDHALLIDLVDEFETGMIEDGTAIGMGLATSLARLRNSEEDSGIVILLTDGVNNTGYIDPLTAAQMAEEMGVRVYTIGVGSLGIARAPVDRRRDGTLVFGNVRVEIDEELLREISDRTGGAYFRADNEHALQEIYEQIDELEKSEIRVENIFHFHSWYRYPLGLAIVLLILYILPQLVFRTFP